MRVEQKPSNHPQEPNAQKLLIEQRLVRLFQHAATQIPAYATLLAERGISMEQIKSAEDFTRLCPVLDKSNTFQRFPLHQLCGSDVFQNLAGVLTSSGHGGTFSYGLISRKQQAEGAELIDSALDLLFGIRSKKTLIINCLPMGVGFSSSVATLATTSVREDMALSLARAFGPYYEQIVIVGDPLFFKLLTDFADEQGVDWARVNIIIGEEIFGENFRNYLTQCFRLDPDRPQDGYISSSMGVAELGLHLFFEVPEVIALRRAAHRNRSFCQDLFGVDSELTALPLLFAYSPERSFVEILEPDPQGYGKLTLTPLEEEAPLPLLRYQTGDMGRLVKVDEIIQACSAHGIPVPEALPNALIAIRGRDKEALPNGRHVGQYKDALYGDIHSARRLTGAFRLEFDADSRCTLHVQLARGVEPNQEFQTRLLESFPALLRPEQLAVWPYTQFPYGLTLDYERKFVYYRPLGR